MLVTWHFWPSVKVDTADSRRQRNPQEKKFRCWELGTRLACLNLKKILFIYFNCRLITLQYCIGFAIHQHESATGALKYFECGGMNIDFVCCK